MISDVNLIGISMLVFGRKIESTWTVQLDVQLVKQEIG